MLKQTAISYREFERSDVRNLEDYANDWLHPSCCWYIPDLNELSAKSQDDKKALVSKSVISLRQQAGDISEAIKNLETNRESLVSAQLDAIALKFGYMPETDAPKIQEKKQKALDAYNQDQKVIEKVNEHLGNRLAATLLLMDNEEGKTTRKNLLSIMRLLKSHEATVLSGAIKYGVFKFSLSMCNELGRSNYAPIIKKLEGELTNIVQHLQASLEKIPSGVIGEAPLKSYIAEEIKALPEQNSAQIQLIYRFEILQDLYKKVNQAVSVLLAEIAVPAEIETEVMPLTPTHQVNQDLGPGGLPGITVS